jgi:hypothetical protein
MTAMGRRHWIPGLLGIGAVLVWWQFSVWGLYGGNWTGLFCTGTKFQVPAPLEFEHVYRTPGSAGFDGQFYHYAAHGPLLGEKFAAVMDEPRLRYQRILVPALAWLLALGKQQYIDRALFLVTLAFVFAGVVWLARLLEDRGVHPLWSLLFLLVPGVTIAVERMTVPDLALTALTLGFCVHLGHGPSWKLYWLMMAAAFTREVGVFLCAAYCVSLLFERRFRTALLFGTAVLPWAAWCYWVYVHTPTFVYAHRFLPFMTVVQLAGQPLESARSHGLALFSRVCDWLALAGMWMAVVWGFLIVRRKGPQPAALVCLAFALLGCYMLSIEEQYRAYDFGRLFSPLLVLVALHGLAVRSIFGALPLALILPRIAVLFASGLLTIAHKLARL